MLSKKQQMEAVKELMDMNKVIVDINKEMAKLHIKKKKIKKSKKSSLNRNVNKDSFFNIFMEELHKAILEEAVNYWVEEHSIENGDALNTKKVEVINNDLLDSSNSNTKSVIEKDNTLRDKVKLVAPIEDKNSKDDNTNKTNELNTKVETTNKENESEAKSNKIVKEENKDIKSLFNTNKVSAKDLFKDVKKVEESSQLSFGIF